MAGLGVFLAGLAWPVHFLILAVFLAVIWFVVRFFERLRPYVGQIMLIAGIFWIGILFFLLTYSFPVPRFAGATDATTIPRVWFYALVPSVVIALIQIIRGVDEPDPKWGNLRLVSIVLAAIVVSISLFNIIGYYISSAIFIASVMWILGSRNKIELIAVPAGWVAFSYLIFARLLHVRLPVGIIFSGLLY